MQINAEKYDVKQELREITFSCCSEQPYARFDQENGIEYEQILVINENSVDLSRLNNGAPVLFNHDTDKLIGMVERAYIAGNKVFVTVRFSANDSFADRIFKDILDGIIKNVSIGYQIEHYQDIVQDGINKRFVDKFLIYETSIVAIPADDRCGIRKFKNKGQKNMKKETEKIEENETENEQMEKQDAAGQIEDGKQDEIESLKIENAELKKEIENLKSEQEKEQPVEAENEQSLDDQTINEIEKMGQDFGVDEQEIQRAIQERLSVKEFKQKIKNINFNIKKEKTNMNSKNEFRNFIKQGNFEKSFMLRDFTGFGGKTGEGGEALIGTETYPLVQALEKIMGVKGFRTLNSLHYNVSIPVQTGRNTVEQTADLRTAASTSNPEFTAKMLVPQKISGNTVIGKELLVQANDDVIAFVIDSLTKEIAYKVEDYMLGKVVSANPTEILYSSLSAIDWADILKFEAAVAGYALTDLSFVGSPATRAALKAIPKAQNYPDFLCNENKVNGYDFNVSGCVSNNNLFFGDWSKLILGVFGDGLEILVNPYKYSTQGNVQVVASICIDAVVEQPQAFAIGKVQAESSSSAE